MKSTKQVRDPKNLHLTVIASAILLIVVFPLIWMILSSFKPEGEMFLQPPNWLPQQWTLENYERLFVTTNFLRFLANTTIVAIGAVVVGVTVALCAVYSVTRYRFVGQRGFAFATLFIYMLPPIVLAIPIFGFWFRAGWTNSLAALMFTYLVLTLPFALWILRPYIESIPRDLEEAAMVDGCARFQAFRKVIVPQALPGIVSATVFTFVVVWNEYLYALVLISDSDKKTVSLGVADLILESSVVSWGMINAAGVLVTVPVLIVFVAFSGKIVSGMTAGAVKS